MMLGILPSLLMAIGSHTANCEGETGTFGSADSTTVRRTDSPMQHATISSLPGLRTRRPCSMPATAGGRFGLQRSVGEASCSELVGTTRFKLATLRGYGNDSRRAI